MAMARTTQAQLDGTAERLNEMLARRGSSARVDVSGRNGHQGLDLETVDEDGKVRTSKCLTIGTKTDMWDYMHAMMEALWLLEEPYVKP